MKILLDTHALLWFVTDDPQLSATANLALNDPSRQRVISIASFWEITIKVGLNKLPLAMPLADFFNQHLWPSKVQLLPIETAHLLKLSTLPLYHRDPFDRLIVAQALAEKLPLVSSDSTLDAYGIQRIW